jgi:hypothetical protein
MGLAKLPNSLKGLVIKGLRIQKTETFLNA